MRTIELINLLRSHDRSSPAAKAHIASLDTAKRLHLLGELCNWLLVELQKYRGRQAGPTAVETLEQGSIRSNIRRTLLAIQVLLDGTHTSPESQTENRTSAPLDEKILERFLTVILVGMAPLGPRVNTKDVQLACAKILCYCINPGAKGLPFPAEVLFRRMMSMSTTSVAPYPALGEQSSGQGHSQGRASLVPDTVAGLTALLKSPLIKLQDYGLRILTSHRSLVQFDLAWELLSPLTSILETLKDNLTKLTLDQPQDSFIEDMDMGGVDVRSTGRGDRDQETTDGDAPSKDLQVAIGIHSKALTLFQWYLQEAGTKTSTGTSSSLPPQNDRSRSSQLNNASKTQADGGNSTKLEKLKKAADTGLFIELWKAIQHIALLDRTKLPSSEKLVLLISATIYWWCWSFQDEAMTCVLTTGADTLMAWYGCYIVPRDHAAPSSDSTIPPTEVTLSNEDIKQQSTILEYITKLIQIMVAPKKLHSIFSGDRPIGIVIMRRTVEFLEGILESKPVILDTSPNMILPQDKTVPREEIPPVYINDLSHSVRVIRDRPGVLEAMLGIMAGCIGASREGDQWVLTGRLVDVMVLLLSDTRQLFSAPGLAETTVRRIYHSTLNVLLLILKRDDDVPGIEEVPMNHWTLGYRSLVNLIMCPLEQEAESGQTTSTSQAGQGSVDGELSVKSLRVLALFWRYHTKGRGMLSDLMAPRFHLLKMVPAVVNTSDSTVGSKAPKWRRERSLLLVETVVYFAQESSVRINMRERWSSLPFLVALLGSCIKRLEDNKFSPRDLTSRAIAQRCFRALRNFWYDRCGLIQLIELNIPSLDSTAWKDFMPTRALTDTQTGSSSSASIVPVLLSIIVPPGTVWSSDLMLCYGTNGRTRRRGPRHPLFERQERILAEAAMLLAQLSQFQECQQRLISKPGLIWLLSRMMVERSLVGNSGTLDESNVSAAAGFDDMPRDMLEKALYEALTKIMTGVTLAHSLVSNNTITEVFAAALEIDQPLYFYSSSLVCKESPMAHSTLVADSNAQNETTSAEDQSEMSDQYYILPTPRQQALHHQLLNHFRTAMNPLRGQFDRIYQYIGGHRSLQDVDETTENMYWLREYCALVFLYLMEPPNPGNKSSWESKIDKTSLLTSESFLGVVCRMLTLELEYDQNEALPETDRVPMDMSHVKETGPNQEDSASVQKEEAMLRRFSAGLAIQSLSWIHTEQWRHQHLTLARSYASVLTTEWKAHAEALNGEASSKSSTDSGMPTEIKFSIQDRVITFPDRLLLSRASPFFHTLLLGDFMEASQRTIVLQDVDPTDFEMLMEVMKESRMTATLLLPEDLPFPLVLRLMVCADRFMVTFIKRLSEAWILQALRTRELKHCELEDSSSRIETIGSSSMLLNDTKRGRDLDDIDGSSSEKRQKLEDDPLSTLSETQEPSLEALLERQREGAKTVTSHMQPKGMNGAKTLEEENDSESEGGGDVMEDSRQQPGHQRENELHAKQSTNAVADQIQEDEAESEESVQECLIMVYEACTDPRYGSLHSSSHPFYGLVWDVLKRMILRLGSVAITTRFAEMLETGGEERIQEFLQTLFELISGQSP
ncbi:hypothetical protein B0O80DRAFT_436622 [Mortierella sp. GBAus27b]|nr:hypothetical protein BGX31_000200 [Mortierella sp. GBA43]KAI8361066.1 hypothetical protein B0O80DRAFT_436622 [Mortierella sp. GBAus27b]